MGVAAVSSSIARYLMGAGGACSIDQYRMISSRIVGGGLYHAVSCGIMQYRVGTERGGGIVAYRVISCGIT